MALTVSVKARWKGALLELITPSYCSNPGTKGHRLEHRWYQRTLQGESICFLCRVKHSTLSLGWLRCLLCAPIEPLPSSGLAWIALCSDTLGFLTGSELLEERNPAWLTSAFSRGLGLGLDTQLWLSKGYFRPQKRVNKYTANSWWGWLIYRFAKLTCCNVRARGAFDTEWGRGRRNSAGLLIGTEGSDRLSVLVICHFELRCLFIPALEEGQHTMII